MEKIIESYKNLLQIDHNILSSISVSYSELSKRIALELGDLLNELDTKTEDKVYAKKVLETNESILVDVQELLNTMVSAMEGSISVQKSVNPEKIK